MRLSDSVDNVEFEFGGNAIALGSTYLSTKVRFIGFVTFNITIERVVIFVAALSKTIKTMSLLTATAK
jgi:hypothetical protein